MVLAVVVVGGGNPSRRGEAAAYGGRRSGCRVGGFGNFGEVRERLFGGQGNGKIKFEQFF
jgi:hypothetical protein